MILKKVAVAVGIVPSPYYFQTPFRQYDSIPSTPGNQLSINPTAVLTAIKVETVGELLLQGDLRRGCRRVATFSLKLRGRLSASPCAAQPLQVILLGQIAYTGTTSTDLWAVFSTGFLPLTPLLLCKSLSLILPSP